MCGAVPPVKANRAALGHPGLRSGGKYGASAWTAADPFAVLMRKDRHDPVVMPGVAHAGGLPLDPFADKTADFIAADGPMVVSENPQVDAVQTEGTEGLFKQQIDRFAADTLPEVAVVEETNGQPRATVVRIKTVQACLADQRAIRFDHPGVGMFQQGTEPAVRLTFAKLGLALGNAAVHPDDLGRNPEGGPREGIFWDRTAKVDLDLWNGHATLDPEAPADDGLLCVKAVFGFVEDDGVRPVHHGACRLIIAVGGQAMHEKRVGLARDMSCSFT